MAIEISNQKGNISVTIKGDPNFPLLTSFLETIKWDLSSINIDLAGYGDDPSLDIVFFGSLLELCVLMERKGKLLVLTNVSPEVEARCRRPLLAISALMAGD